MCVWISRRHEKRRDTALTRLTSQSHLSTARWVTIQALSSWTNYILTPPCLPLSNPSLNPFSKTVSWTILKIENFRDAWGPRFHKSTLWPHILHLEGFHLRRGRPIPKGGHGPFVVELPLQRGVDEETDGRGRAISDWQKDMHSSSMHITVHKYHGMICTLVSLLTF